MSGDQQELRDSIRRRFSRLARAPEEETTFPIGPDSARRLGYPEHEIEALPVAATESFAGVGYPLSLDRLEPGERVLDIGCGAGLDLILAARAVAPEGTAIGVDMLAEMLVKAGQNLQAAGIGNAGVIRGEADDLPLASQSVDVVLSNGVLNLCLDKPRVMAEVCRVLRPGGRLLMADILLSEEMSPEQLATIGTWSD